MYCKTLIPVFQCLNRMSLGFRCYRSLLRETRSPVVALVDPVIDVVSLNIINTVFET